MIVIDKIVRSFWGLLLLFSAIVFGATSLTQLAYTSLVVSSNINQINELSQRSLKRAELIVDSAVSTLTQLSMDWEGNCSIGWVSEIRRISFLRGSVKDIQVLRPDGSLICSGNVFSQEFGFSGAADNTAYPSSNSNVILYDITRQNTGLVGVGLRLEDGSTLLAVLNLENLMLDVFPSALRDHARADLLLGGEVEIASHIPQAQQQPSPDELMEIFTQSEHLPLGALFNIHSTILETWNKNAEPLVLMGGALLGVVLGLLSTSVLGRPPDPDHELRCAVRNGEFVPFMQPIFTIDGAKIVGCEVLTRWVKPDGSIVQPHRFIPQAEESGLIVPMTRFVMKEALRVLKSQLSADPHFKVAFNIVPSDLVSEAFSCELCAIVKEAGVARRQVVLELTERQDFVDLDLAVKAIGDLQELGFRVALDDTGTGHNGLSYVQQLGADIIKIDKHFIDRIGVDHAATTIVQMLVRLADELGMRTVAEGIETEQQLKALRECGVDEGQGFLISPPVPVAEFLDLVRAQDAPKKVLSAA